MRDEATTSSDPVSHLVREGPDDPVLFFAPEVLADTARAFREGFPGLVSYAVKANPGRPVLEVLVAAGVRVFDTASVPEMRAVRAVLPRAVLHYHNPVRSRAEIALARALGVVSWSVDRAPELAKLDLPPGSEVVVRLKLPVAGAAYDFGAKFGAAPAQAAELLAQAAARRLRVSLTFHPGTQCEDARAWERYIAEAAVVARAAGVRLHRLNVGGGFAAHRGAGPAPDLGSVFERIGAAARAAFDSPPELVCEPGRAMVAGSHLLALRVKAVSDDALFLNDGIYGHLAEWRDMGAGQLRVISPEGVPRTGAPCDRVVFGPTCDSLDRLPEPLALPRDVAEEDYLLIPSMGAYGSALATGFNGYGRARQVLVASLRGAGHCAAGG